MSNNRNHLAGQLTRCAQNSQNPGITKICLPPSPLNPILALVDLTTKARKCDRDKSE